MLKLNHRGQYEKKHTVVFKNKKIKGKSGDKGHSKLYTAYELYDLIKADLVEKVEE